MDNALQQYNEKLNALTMGMTVTTIAGYSAVIATIERTTKTQIFLANGKKYSRRTGCEVGYKGNYPHMIVFR